jgi:hypothetical protein
MTSVWLRGPVPGVEPMLQPVAHAFLQAREDLARIVPELTAEELWQRPGEMASPGFHVQHAAGSLDRLMTYARGAELSAEQREALDGEQSRGESGEVLLDRALRIIDAALAELKTIPISTLTEPRAIGRARLPSTVIGVLVHAAEHTARHVGQLTTTVGLMRRGVTGRADPT